MVYGQCIGKVALQRQTGILLISRWKGVLNNRNDSYGSQCNQRESNTRDSPGNNVKVSRFVFNDIIHLGDITRSLFNGYNITESP